MSTPLAYSIFHDIIFPKSDGADVAGSEHLKLRKTVRHNVRSRAIVSDLSLVVFDFETTGLDDVQDRIIEIGAQKIVSQEVVSEFSVLINPGMPLPAEVERITGITDDMLVGKPSIAEVLPDFLKFIEGHILVAHNAAFDMGFLRNSCSGIGVDVDWPSFCTLKMARELLPGLERKNLDTLAEYYGLQFEARHRSIGDVKVTVEVLHNMLQNEGQHIRCWEDLSPFCV